MSRCAKSPCPILDQRNTTPPETRAFILKSATLSSKRSGFNALLPPCPPLTRVPQHRSIVVGARYPGLGAARRMAELLPDEQIFVLEALGVGEGASGRNSEVLRLDPNQPEANANGTARGDALRKIRIQTVGLDWLRSLVTWHRIDCDWDGMGTAHLRGRHRRRRAIYAWVATELGPAVPGALRRGAEGNHRHRLLPVWLPASEACARAARGTGARPGRVAACERHSSEAQCRPSDRRGKSVPGEDFA